MDYKNITMQVVQLSKKVGEFIKKSQINLLTNDVEEKGLHDFVTYVDKQAEQQIIDGLKLILPEAGFIAEEETETELQEKFNWIVDPLDGTTNYIHGLAPFAVSIALQENNKTVLGVVYEISMSECFYAWKDSKAYLNEKEIKVSDVAKVADSLVATGFPYHDYSRLDKLLNSLSYFMEKSHGIRRFGSAATDLAYLACGRFDSFFEYGLSPWDVVSGAFIVQQAGGKVSDFSGGDNYIFGKEIAAANSKTFDEFLNIIKQEFNS